MENELKRIITMCVDETRHMQYRPNIEAEIGKTVKRVEELYKSKEYLDPNDKVTSVNIPVKTFKKRKATKK